MWHGTREERVHSILRAGFTYFGKENFAIQKEGERFQNTDDGYFGSGIYFTDSAEYAAMYSQGVLIMAWILMRQPFSLISDVHEGGSTDMRNFVGRPAYKNYNAHYIPVRSINPDKPECMDFYTCTEDQLKGAPWNEFVIFQGAHTLAQFSVEFGPKFYHHTFLSLAMKFAFQKCIEGDLYFLQNWINSRCKNLRAIKGPNGETLMYYAAMANQIMIIKWFFGIFGKEFLSEPSTPAKYLPLHGAVIGGHEGAMTLIHREDRHQINAINEETGWTLFHYAAVAGQEGACYWLLRNNYSLLNRTDCEGKNAAHIAAIYGKINILELALNPRTCPEGRDLVFALDYQGNSVMHLAAAHGQLKVCQFLHQQFPDLVQQVNSSENSVLHAAVRGNNGELIEFLCSLPENLILKFNKRGETVLHTAAAAGLVEMIRLILSQESSLLHAKSKEGKTPIHCAIIAGHEEAMDFLIEAGADPFEQTYKTFEGFNGLHYCAQNQRLKLLMNLLSRPFNKETILNAKDSFGQTPLYLGIASVDIVKALHEAGADLNTPTHPSVGAYTPLHIAAKKGYFETVKYLIRHGANAFDRDQNGETALDLAIKFDYEQIASCLAAPRKFQDDKISIISNPVADFHHNYYQAIESKDITNQIFFLQRLGQRYLDHNDYIKATQYFNTATQICLNNDVESSMKKYVYYNLERLERRVLHDVNGITSPIDRVGFIESHRTSLWKLYSVAEEALHRNEPPHIIAAEFTAHVHQLLKGLIDHYIAALRRGNGDKALPKFAVIGLGCLAKETMVPFSSFEFGIIHEQPKEEDGELKFYKELCQFLQLNVMNLGETPFAIGQTSLLPSGFRINLRDGIQSPRTD